MQANMIHNQEKYKSSEKQLNSRRYYNKQTITWKQLLNKYEGFKQNKKINSISAKKMKIIFKNQ